MPQPRPLYRLPELLSERDKQILIVEGEKCADAAAELLPKMAATTWAGGTNAWQLSQWQHIAKRSVVLWPDNDDPGRGAMLGRWRRGEWEPGIVTTLLDAGCKVKVFRPPSDRPKGWDIADAAEAGLGPAEILLMLKAETEPWTHERVETHKALTKPAEEPSAPPEPQEPASDNVVELRPREQRKPKPDKGQAKPGDPTHDEPPDQEKPWLMRLVMDPKTERVVARSKENFRLFLANHSMLKGCFAWNRFAEQVQVVRRPPWHKGSFSPHLLTDADIIHAAGYLEHIGLRPTKSDAKDALLVASMEAAFNPVTTFFSNLKWDGVPRIRGGTTESGEVFQPWLTEYMEAVDSPINRAFGMRWLIAAVARAFVPGTKVDTMLVLEGPQAKRKSSALEILGTIDGVSYYQANMPDFHSKDAMQVLWGKLIVEVAEMDALRKSEASAVKKMLSVRVDEFRAPYAATVQPHPRTSVFAGTINPRPGAGGYLRDVTGNRRFWPVPVGDIDIDRLKEDQPQLWAEAVHLYRAGEQHWLTPEEEALAKPEQERRQEEEPWTPLVAALVEGQREVTTPDILARMNIPAERRTPDFAAKVADILVQQLGYVKMQRQRPGRKPETYYLLTTEGGW